MGVWGGRCGRSVACSRPSKGAGSPSELNSRDMGHLLGEEGGSRRGSVLRFEERYWCATTHPVVLRSSSSARFPVLECLLRIAWRGSLVAPGETGRLPQASGAAASRSPLLRLAQGERRRKRSLRPRRRPNRWWWHRSLHYRRQNRRGADRRKLGGKGLTLLPPRYRNAKAVFMRPRKLRGRRKPLQHPRPTR